MKVVMKKILVSLMLIVVMFNFIYTSNICYAAEITAEEVVNTISNLIGGVVSIAIWPLRIKIVAISFIISETILTTLAAADGGTSTLFVTPYEIFFNEISITDINFFNFTDGGKVSTLFREEVAKWFYFVRTVAVAILLVVLVYVGIRMAISLFADDKAKYKKMLVDWFMSLALLFVMQYIILFLIELNNVIVSALKSAVEQSDVNDFMWDLAWNGMIGVGISSITSAIVYAAVVILTLAFLIAYINRMLRVGFLIIISPLITITYSLDKMKDSKSQALNTWFKELLFTILLQPFHCIIYYSFISVCFNLISDTSILNSGGLGDFVGDATQYNQLAAAVLAILSIVFIKQAEKIVRTIFGFNDVADKASVATGIAVTAAALTKAKGAGSAVRSMQGAAQNLAIGAKLKEGVNAFTNTKFGGAVKSKIDSSAGAQKVKNAVGRIGDTANKVSDKAKNLSKKIKNIKNAPKRFFDKMDEKLTKDATDMTKSKFKRFTARAKKNGLSRIRKLNGVENAIGAIAGTATLISQDGALGKAAAATVAASQAAQAYKEGSTDAFKETMQDSENFADDKDALKDDSTDVVDAQKALDDAKKETKKAQAQLKANKNSPAAKKAHQDAIDKENAARKKLKEAKEKAGEGKKANLKRRYEELIDAGKRGDFKADSAETQFLEEQMSKTMEDLLIQAGAPADACGVARESTKRLREGIKANTGLTDNFGEKNGNLHAIVEQMITDLESKVPDVRAKCAAEIAAFEASVSAYRHHNDEAYSYRKLSQYMAGGGNLDNLVDDLYDSAQENEN